MFAFRAPKVEGIAPGDNSKHPKATRKLQKPRGRRTRAPKEPPPPPAPRAPPSIGLASAGSLRNPLFFVLRTALEDQQPTAANRHQPPTANHQPHQPPITNHNRHQPPPTATRQPPIAANRQSPIATNHG